ncbi:MAG: hypothetical protein ACKOWF_18705 [Chloroflexota bacterium]
MVNASDFRIVAPTGKVLQFDISAIAANTTRTLSAPNLDGTYETTTGAQVVRDKTFTPSTASDPAAIFKGVNSQTGPLMLLRDSNNLELARISADNLDNTWFGKTAGSANTTGSNNTGIGSEALKANVNGGFNVALGRRALTKNTSGSNNVSIGNQALFNNTSGGSNVAVGFQSLLDVATGQFNTGVGYQVVVAEGEDYSTAFGVSATASASYATSVGPNSAVGADHGVALGSSSQVLSLGVGSVAIGRNALVSDPDVIQLGTTDTVVRANNFVPTPSDVRDKADVRDTVLGLDFILALRPVDYRYDFREDYRPAAPANPGPGASQAARAAYEQAFAEWTEAIKLANLSHDGTRKRERFHHGLIAQEVAGLLADHGFAFGGFQDGTVNGGEDRQSLAYPEFIAPMIRAIQQLAARHVEDVERLQTEVAMLKARLDA